MTSGFISCHDQLILDLLLQLSHMGNDPDETGASGHFLKDADGLLSGMIVQRSKALVNEYGVQLDAAGIEVDQFTPRRRLEDAFLALVGDNSRGSGDR